jgi:hypothetical protein
MYKSAYFLACINVLNLISHVSIYFGASSKLKILRTYFKKIEWSWKVNIFRFLISNKLSNLCAPLEMVSLAFWIQCSGSHLILYILIASRHFIKVENSLVLLGIDSPRLDMVTKMCVYKWWALLTLQAVL